MRDDRERLLDVQEAMERIEKYAARGRQAFEADELVQTWIVHHIRIIGEACRGLSDELKAQHPNVPWPQIVGMRNILVHHYFDVDFNIVWTVVKQDLPDLKTKVAAILQMLPPSP